MVKTRSFRFGIVTLLERSKLPLSTMNATTTLLKQVRNRGKALDCYE